MDRLTVPGRRPYGGPYTPPPIGGEPRLYALLAVEVEPGKIVYFHLELDHEPGACTIDLEHNTDPFEVPAYLDPLRYITAGPTRINATLSGTVVSRQADYRPPARTASVPAQLTAAQHALPAAPKDTP